MKIMEDPQHSAAGEINVDEQTEELGEASMAMMEREGEMEINGERSQNAVQVTGGYRKDRPPEDDCCPICHDDFHIPCRTNCGHWYCANCILLIWKYMAKFKQCVCPICGSLIFNLVPHSSALIQPEEEVGEILKEIQRYSSQHMVGWFGIFRKALALPRFTYKGLHDTLLLMRLTLLLFRLNLLVYQIYGFHLLSNVVQMLFCMCTFAVLIFIIWKRWKRLRRERQMAEQNVIP